eukprot:TRINITY_DN10822_c0_g1_i1.p1 TRINITY_DN10822_c0_g1~~TRINITY_DN10822_c0_g1_i1.p1  ORF type:complete len:939 (-),score=268.52 TRINITY_DN10822_c0_g1_i1:32-2848(-)
MAVRHSSLDDDIFNNAFLKLFSLNQELLIKEYSCCLLDSNLSRPRRGSLYVSHNYVAFHSPSKQIKEVMPIGAIKKVKRIEESFVVRNTRMEVPRGIIVILPTKEFIFSNFLHPEEAYSLLQELTERELFELSHKLAVTNIESMIENAEHSNTTNEATTSLTNSTEDGNFDVDSTTNGNGNGNNGGVSLTDSGESLINVEERTLKRLKNDPAYDAKIRAQFLIPSTEPLFADYGCALEGVQYRLGILPGRMFLFANSICFFSDFYGAASHVKLFLPFGSILSIRSRYPTSSSSASSSSPSSSASSRLFILPNPIIITVNKQQQQRQYTFSSFFNRTQAYDTILRAWRSWERPADDAAIPLETGDIDGWDGINLISQRIMTDSAHHVFEDEYGFAVPLEFKGKYEVEMYKYKFKLDKLKSKWESYLSSSTSSLQSIAKVVVSAAAASHAPPQSIAIANTIPKRLQKLVRNGIPKHLRGELWYNLLGGSTKPFEANVNISYDVLAASSSPSLKEIDKDIPRTFPRHQYFQSLENQDKLRRILVAYANRNPKIGYCQSMNFIAAMLELVMGEEKAFWTLSAIVEDRLSYYFAKSMIGLLVDQKIFEELFRLRLPLLYDHLTAFQFPISLIVTKWFMCLFIDSLPTETALRIIDCFCIEGVEIIFLVSLALFSLMQKTILSLNNPEDIFNYIGNKVIGWFDVEELLETAYSFPPISKQYLDEMRFKNWSIVETKLESQERKRNLVLLKSGTHFTQAEIEDMYKKHQNLQPTSFNAGIDFFIFKTFLKDVAPEWISDPLLVAKLFQVWDSNSDGALHFRELVRGLSTLLKGSIEERAKLYFQLFSQDGTKMKQNECKTMLTSLSKVYKESADVEVLQRVAEKIFEAERERLQQDDKEEEATISVETLTEMLADPLFIEQLRLDPKVRSRRRQEDEELESDMIL